MVATRISSLALAPLSRFLINNGFPVFLLHRSIRTPSSPHLFDNDDHDCSRRRHCSRRTRQLVRRQLQHSSICHPEENKKWEWFKNGAKLLLLGGHRVSSGRGKFFFPFFLGFDLSIKKKMQ